MKKVKFVISFLLAVVLTSALLTLATILIFNGNNKKVDNGASSVPYYEQTPPDNVGLLFRFSQKGSVFLNLDYQSEKISVITFFEKIAKQKVLDYGYGVSYTFDTDYIFLADFIDRFGGLEFQSGENLQRYTGVQIIEMLEKKELSEKQVIAAVLTKINYLGFSKNDLTFIIRNTDTDLSYPSGYPLIWDLKKLCTRINFVN